MLRNIIATITGISLEPPRELGNLNDLNIEFSKIVGLCKAGCYAEAWPKYVELCKKETYSNPFKYEADKAERCARFGLNNEPSSHIFIPPVFNWHRIPPEGLLEYILIGLSHQDPIFKFIPLELVRDCATVYEHFALQCVREDKLWLRLSCFPEYVADIAQGQPQAAYQIVTSSRGADIKDDRYRMEIFRYAVPMIHKSDCNPQQLKCLIKYLLKYNLVISQKDYSEIEKVAKKHSQTESLKILWKAVLGKLSLQGILQKDQNLSFDTQYEDLVEFLFDEKHPLSEVKIFEKLNIIEKDECFQQALIYLMMINKNSMNFSYANMVLGHLLAEQGQKKAAGFAYLFAAQIDRDFHSLTMEEKSIRKEALMLAAQHLIVKTSNQQLNLRAENPKPNQQELSINEIKEIAGDIPALSAFVGFDPKKTTCFLDLLS